MPQAAALVITCKVWIVLTDRPEANTAQVAAMGETYLKY